MLPKYILEYFLVNLMCLYLHVRFTELYVEELESESDLRILVSDYLKGLNLNRTIIHGIIRFDNYDQMSSIMIIFGVMQHVANQGYLY